MAHCRICSSFHQQPARWLRLFGPRRRWEAWPRGRRQNIIHIDIARAASLREAGIVLLFLSEEAHVLQQHTSPIGQGRHLLRRQGRFKLSFLSTGLPKQLTEAGRHRVTDRLIH